MIGTVLFLLCATAIAYAHIQDTDLDGFYENGCPKDTSIEKVMPHENCAMYYQCYHGALLARYCPNGLHFNADLEKCDWLANADCHKKRNDVKTGSEVLDKTNPGHVSLICSLPDSDGVLVAHKVCNLFYKCSLSKSLVLNCARDLLYNTVTERCDMPDNVECGERVRYFNESITTTTTSYKNTEYSYSVEEIDDQSNSDPSKAIAQCSAKRSDGVLIAHDHCNKFYKCSGGVPSVIKCPTDLLYNPIKEMCDWPRNVDCEDRIVFADKNNNNLNDNNNEDTEISSDDDEYNAFTICASDDTEGILVAHEMCNHFYKCTEKKPVAFSCPGDLLYNSIKNYCDWPNNVDCGERMEPTDSSAEKKKRSEDPTQAHFICSSKGADGTLVTHENCDKYYKCHDGRAIVVDCPDVLLYSPKREKCEWPTHVYCKDRIIPEKLKTLKNVENNKVLVKDGSLHDNLNANLNNAVQTCQDDNFEGKLLPHENCNQFYKCLEGKPMTLFCPLNLYYNPQKQNCDWSYNVKCGKRLVPGNYSNGEEETKDDNISCRDQVDGTVTPSENCSQFYKCLNGQAYPLNCPPGLYFNALHKYCDWPMNVDCGERLTETQLENKRSMRALGVARLP